MLKKRRNSDPLSEINIIPLVDIIMVLLVIFMITAPVVTKTLNIQLPREDLRSTQVTKSRKFVVTLNRKGSIYLNGKRLNEKKLLAESSLWKKRYPKEPVFIRADKRVDYGKVMEVMALIKNSGITNIGLLIQDKKKS